MPSLTRRIASYPDATAQRDQYWFNQQGDREDKQPRSQHRRLQYRFVELRSTPTPVDPQVTLVRPAWAARRVPGHGYCIARVREPACRTRTLLFISWVPNQPGLNARDSGRTERERPGAALAYVRYIEGIQGPGTKALVMLQLVISESRLTRTCVANQGGRTGVECARVLYTTTKAD